MSRFGVFSLLLVLGLDLGTSLTPGCNDMFCKLKSLEDESGFREASLSDSLLGALVGALLPGSSSEDTTLRKFHSDDGEELGNLHLTEVEEDEHGFRHHGQKRPHTQEKKHFSPADPDTSFRYVVNKRYLRSKSGSKKSSNFICKYTKAILRRIVEIIRPYFS